MTAGQIHLDASPARVRLLGPGLGVALGCAVAALACAGWTSHLALLGLSLAEVGYLALMDLVGAASLVVAVVVGVRRPSSPVAALLAFQGLVPFVIGVSDAWTNLVTGPGLALTVTTWGAALAEASWMLWFVPAAMLLLVFPTGRLLDRRWLPVALGLVVAPLAFTGSLLALGPDDGAFAGVAAPLPAGPGLSAVAGSRGRLHRSRCWRCCSPLSPPPSSATGAAPGWSGPS